MNAASKELLTNGDLWTALGGISLAGLACLIALAAITKARLNRPWTVVCVAGLIAGISGTMLQAPHPNDARVLSSDTPLLLSPFEEAEVKAVLESGEDVRTTKIHGEFVHVAAASGTAGWVEKSALSRYVGKW